MQFKVVVIGVSAGGLNALKVLFSNIDNDLKLPIIIVQHMHPESDNYLANYLSEFSSLNIKEADEKEQKKCQEHHHCRCVRIHERSKYLLHGEPSIKHKNI